MKFSYTVLFLITLFINPTECTSQCSFELLSNDTIYQDYIELTYANTNVDKIVTIGSRINRGTINNNIFNAPTFKSFDYCGNLLIDTFYLNFGSIKISHRPLEKHYTYKNEPIGNKAIVINENEFLIVDNGIDTLTNDLSLILFRINDNGVILGYNSFNINDEQANHRTIKHVIKLKDGNILVILWDYFNEYNFLFFNSKLQFEYNKKYVLPRGIRSLKEIEDREFICTSLAFDSLSFEFYRLDTNGQIKWKSNPFNIKGSASEVQIIKDKIYVTGGANQFDKGTFGAFIKSDLNGNILKQYKFDTINNGQRLCSAFIESENEIIITGYVYNLSENRAEDIIIFKLDSSGNINNLQLFNFIPTLGTTGPRGLYKDYGGFGICKSNDGGVITYGNSQYKSNLNGVVLHEDATLIKTKPILITNNSHVIADSKIKYALTTNPIKIEINLTGPLYEIKSWKLFNLHGVDILKGKNWSNSPNIQHLPSGVYFLKIVDRFNYNYILKLVKE